LAMVGYIHLAPHSDVNPYIYAGLGAMLYKRVNGADVYIPNSEFNSSVLVPVGLGLEIAVSQNISLVADAGYHVTDDYTDYIKAGNLGSYVTGKVGFNILLGTSDAGDADNDG